MDFKDVPAYFHKLLPGAFSLLADAIVDDNQDNFRPFSLRETLSQTVSFIMRNVIRPKECPSAKDKQLQKELAKIREEMKSFCRQNRRLFKTVSSTKDLRQSFTQIYKEKDHRARSLFALLDSLLEASKGSRMNCAVVYVRAYIYKETGNRQDAIKEFSKLIGLLAGKSPKKLYIPLFQIASVAKQSFKYDLARQCLLKALKLSWLFKLTQLQLDCYNKLSFLFFHCNQIELARVFFNLVQTAQCFQDDIFKSFEVNHLKEDLQKYDHLKHSSVDIFEDMDIKVFTYSLGTVIGSEKDHSYALLSHLSCLGNYENYLSYTKNEDIIPQEWHWRQIVKMLQLIFYSDY